MTNSEVARIFNEIADLMEIKGGDSFRISSYRRVARTIADLAEDIEDIARRGALLALDGVGKPSAEKIETLLRTGSLPLRDELASAVPETLLALLGIPGMGPKKVALLWKELDVTSLDSLKEAIAAGRLAGLKGFGDKSIEKMKEGIDFLQRSSGRTRLGLAAATADIFRDAVARIDGVERAEIAGSVRRGCESIGDIDILCVASSGAAVVQRFTTLPGVTKVIAAGDTKGSVLAMLGTGDEIQIDLRVVPGESFGAAWQYFTGSKEHNVRLRELALKRGWTLNEYALKALEGGAIVAAREEKQIYKALDLPWIPPELREDRGEFQLKQTPTDLVELSDIRGDLHMHTVASDGRASIEEMAEAAKSLGYAYICITDHSHSSVIANGLDVERLLAHVRAIRAASERVPGITIWAGAEVDIRADGSLDYPDEALAQLDWVVASNHYHQTRDQAANTERAVRAIQNRYVNMLAHPTGRMIGRRDAAPLDMHAVAAAAAQTGTALEINASTYRLDLRDQHARLAGEHGAVICINTDSHAPQQLDQMRFGVLTARRAWLKKEDVLNTRTARQVAAFVKAKRERIA